MEYITVKNISYAYEDENVLNDVSFNVKAGEFVLITGENGAAKSTLLKIILGLLKSKTGEANIATKNIYNQKMIVGYAPQQIASFNVGFPSTVYELVKSGRYITGKWFKKLNAHDLEHVDKSLHAVNMYEFKDRKIGELSGGQKQRIFLARLFASDPDLFILDEPTTGMDAQSKEAFYKLLSHSCRKHKKAVLMVTHEDGLIDKYADKHIRLFRKENLSWKCFSMTSCKERS